MHKEKVIIRVDGNSEIGLGHISRCCALADMLKNDFDIFFYTRAQSNNILNDLKKYCTDVSIMNGTISFEEEASIWINDLNGDEIVVLDGYNFNTNYQLQIKDKGCKLVCIDDIHAYHFVADAVINHAPRINAKQYSAEPYTQFYVGTEYVLLKKFFLAEAAVKDKTFNLNDSPFLICLGGADPHNVTAEVLEQVLNYFPGRNINVVVGTAYIHLSSLQKNCSLNKQVSLHINVQPGKMLSLMQQSHIAITSSSTIALEYCCVKGNLFLKLTAENQKDIYSALIKKKCAYPFEKIKEKYLFNDSISNQNDLIDGKSGQRLLQLFSDLIYAQ